ncbi:HI0074 family nucleotidyltransferase substrate-binding subunit [Candidatus Cetobacterium colombiensis]|jgi:nucleotidyltransferase substrate binding protein (TIGR01987 family)|uniref:HI0074 family nucleotidyltransferase substrate-binding subunit n=1 Tax=Candidatus Cetobacterium colombiensis TaxID=3073100 RepID=A0ABU4WCA4_9FUSO|nr:HI0074 family nucleotidyltransferase substrate-binding subunit [Candidatus Cetobacterium colombiensis]MDX8337168.1 HI0074 family nucleotidyltransferase substrate-binding subunit [Candidatus Cetobacterium colombiensis]
MYGLSENDFFLIIDILKKYKEKIEWVKIFGSRARGDFKKYSDVDLAISLRYKNIMSDIKNEFYESNLKYTVDIINYSENLGENIKKNIDNDGILIYKTKENGEILMNENKLKYKLEDYQKALKKLKLALEKDAHLDELYLDGTIQRFEFVYELSWKLMKNYLEYQGVDVTSPRETFREAFKEGLIDDASKWIDLMLNRNRTSHTYNEETAWDIYDKIKMEYVKLFTEFEKEIVKRL